METKTIYEVVLPSNSTDEVPVMAANVTTKDSIELEVYNSPDEMGRSKMWEVRALSDEMIKEGKFTKMKVTITIEY